MHHTCNLQIVILQQHRRKLTIRLHLTNQPLALFLKSVNLKVCISWITQLKIVNAGLPSHVTYNSKRSVKTFHIGFCKSLFLEMIESNLKNYYCLYIARVLFCIASPIVFSVAAFPEEIVVFAADTQTLDLTPKLHPMATARAKLTLDVVGSDSIAKDQIDLVSSREGTNTTWYIVTLKNGSQISRNTVLSLRDSDVTAVFASGGRGKISGPHDHSVSVKLEPAANITLALESPSVPKNVFLQDAVLSDGINSRSSLMTLFAILSALVFAGFVTVFYFWRKVPQKTERHIDMDLANEKFERRSQRRSVLGIAMGKSKSVVSPPYLEKSHSVKISDGVEDAHSFPALVFGKKEVDRDQSVINDLRAAFERGQIVVCFQPIFRLSDRRIETIEASIQWLHPKHGILAWPYIAAVAANDPILQEIDEFLIELAVDQVGRWNKQNPNQQPLNLIVNAGGVYEDAKSYCKTLSYLALRSGLLRNMITIQMQTASLGYYRENVREFTNHIKLLGFGFAGGNFGRDGSDLFVLRSFIFDCVSLDCSLLDKDANERDSVGFLKATIDYLRNLSDKIIVTGIRDELSLRAAYQLGCRHGQGYPFAILLTSDNLFEFLEYNMKKQVLKKFNKV
jgi:EAL domain-containing protein (putative c-di-GMP-specific phosphodiesterase class I)